MAELTVAVPARGTFFGQPRGLLYLAFTEAWERFSFYGMTALLVLYMTQQLFLPGHVESIAGFSSFRAGLEAVFGSMSRLALASQIFGLYTGFVYLTPVFGGMIADRWIGRKRAVMLGAVLMSGGHIAMAFDVSFLLALFLLVVGCGFLKGNISVQVGALYAENDGAGRTRGFSIFSMAINVGAVTGPLLCGLLAQIYGWHAGFALAGVLMLIGLATYLAGYSTLTEPAHKPQRAEATQVLGRNEWRIIAALLGVMLLTVFQSIAYYQIGNIGLVFVNDHVDMTLLRFRIPVAWFSSLDSFVSIVAVPPLFALWRWQASHGGEPDEMAKIATGAWMAVAANLVVALGSLMGPRVPMIFPVMQAVLHGIAFLYYWPTLLALVSRAAPPSLKATMMGIAFLTLFLSNTTIGRIGGLYETMTPAAFWTMHAVIAAIGGTLALIFAGPLGRILNGSAR